MSFLILKGAPVSKMQKHCFILATQQRHGYYILCIPCVYKQIPSMTGDQIETNYRKSNTTPLFDVIQDDAINQHRPGLVFYS